MFGRLARSSALSMASHQPPAARLLKLSAVIFFTLTLCACAGQSAYRDGRDLLAKGHVEEGMAKLQEAIKQDPRAVEYKAAYLQARDHALATYVMQAEQLASAQDWNGAEKLYHRALAIHPGSERTQNGLRTIEAGKRHKQLIAESQAAWDKQDVDGATKKLASILTENPRHSEASALQRTILEKTAKPSVELALADAYKKPITIEFRDVALKQVFEVISRTSGLNFLFDKDVKTDQKTSIFLKNSTIESAVHFTLLTNQLEQQILDGNTILVYPNTPAKQKSYQEMLVKSFFLSNADVKTVATTLKTIVKSRDVVIDEKLNMLIVRDSPDAIRLVEKLIALHDLPEPEVMLEVEILEVKRTRLQELGIQWPGSLSLVPLPPTAGSVLTLRDLRNNINSGTLGAAIAPVTLNARLLDSDANILANPRIRARNREKAKILIGERVPNITTTSTSTGFVSESINYVDVGLKLDVEPTIYLDNEVAIKVSLEVSNIVSQLQTKSGSVAYQIGTRTASTVLRLKDGENQVLAGLINDEDRTSGNKVPGLGQLPVVGRLFGSTADNSQKTEIVLSITPRLIRNIQRPNAAMSEFRAGTDSSFRLRPESGMSLQAPAALKMPATAQQPRAALPAGYPASIASPPAPVTDALPSSNGAVEARTQAATAILWQGPAETTNGQTFSVQITMQPEQPVINMPMAVGFDSKVLQVVGVTEGDFLKQDGAQTSFTSRVDPSGQVLMTGTRADKGGATKPGVIASISFRSLATAEATSIRLLTAGPSEPAGRPVATPLPAPHVVRVQP